MSIEIGMPQMAANGLSENWLFKFCGDYHWQKLCERLNRPSAVLCDDAGNRLYPTFVAIAARYSRPLCTVTENEKLEQAIDLSYFGRSFFCSTVKVANDRTVLSQEMITAFVSRLKSGKNELKKSTPESSIVYGAGELSGPTTLLEKAKLFRKGALERYELCGIEISLKGPCSSATIGYSPSPYHDYNGANLLYFASYPTICDSLERLIIQRDKLLPLTQDWALSSSTIARDVYYHRNLDIGRPLTARINQIKQQGEQVLLHTTLIADDEQLPLADIFTVKQLSLC